MTGLPFTDPRFLASLQPDREPEPTPVTHWRTGTHPNYRLACGETSGRSNAAANQVTCEDCQNTVVRTQCLTPTPGDLLGLEVICRQKVDADGLHKGPHDWEKPLTSPLTANELTQALAGNPPPSDFTQREMEDFSGYVAYAAEAEVSSPSGLLPVRVPGAALAEAQEAWEDEGGTPGHPEAERAGETNLARRVGRWIA